VIAPPSDGAPPSDAVIPSDVMVGFVVAGGQSRRMGRDKALLPWTGGTLLDHAVTRLRAVCREVRVLSGADRRYADRALAVDVDAIADGGPLAGLATALAVAAPRSVLLLGVDMPFVTVPLLAHLRDSVAGADAAVPVLAAGAEPLCAAYGATCAAAVQEALAAGARKMTSFWPRVRVRRLDEGDLARFRPFGQLFRNLNDPGEYDAALAASDAARTDDP
jgi:molybdopterin-guanine dinucleotide biosynthesis protein A